MKKKILTIGEFSKISGVNPKSLLYYERLGILNPVYTDPQTKYRYYSFFQKAVVDAIQFCIKLDIPLKNFNKFVNLDEPYICYSDLVNHGTRIVEEKIKIMQEQLLQLKNMKAEIERSEISYTNTEPKEYTLSSRDCWIIPYDGRQLCDESEYLLKKMIFDIRNKGINLGYAYGLLLMRYENRWKQFLFADVQATEDTLEKYPQILHIPSGRYLCKIVDHSGIEQAWEWCLPLINREQIQLIIETELFIGNYTFYSPIWEQRCLLCESDL